MLYKAKSTSILNPYLKYSNSNSKYQPNNNYSYNNRNNNIFLNSQKDSKSKEENINQFKNFIKETNKQLVNSRNNKYIYNKDEKIPKQKSFMEDFIIPNEIKKEYISEINKENNQINYGTASTNDSKYLNNKVSNSNYKIKKEKIRNILNYEEKDDKIRVNKSYKIYNSGTQRNYSKQEKNDFNDFGENLLGDQNNSKFLMYYKEIYEENKK